MKTLKVGLIQNDPRPGLGTENLEKALPLIIAAAEAGAILVALPELSATGYQPNRGIWATAEPAGAASERWLAAHAEKLGIHLCAGYLEAEGGDFFNSYVVASPNGRIVGKVRKESPSMAECHLFKAQPGSHIIDTPLGRLGIGICNDNHMAYLPGKLRQGMADLFLMPHAWPFPTRPSKLVNQADIDRQRNNMVELPFRYAKGLGIPVLFTNLAGRLETGGQRSPGFLGALMPPPEDYQFTGYAAIHAAGGERLASREHGTGWLVGEIEINRDDRQEQAMPAYGSRVYPANADSAILRLYEAMGRRDYDRSSRRRIAAARIRPGK